MNTPAANKGTAVIMKSISPACALRASPTLLVELDCYVISVGRKYFWARMVERSTGEAFDGRIPIARVTKRDRNVFRVGAIFTLRGNRGRSSLAFSHRRWTKKELAESHKHAQRLIQHLQHSGDDNG